MDYGAYLVLTIIAFITSFLLYDTLKRVLTRKKVIRHKSLVKHKKKTG